MLTNRVLAVRAERRPGELLAEAGGVAAAGLLNRSRLSAMSNSSPSRVETADVVVGRAVLADHDRATVVAGRDVVGQLERRRPRRLVLARQRLALRVVGPHLPGAAAVAKGQLRAGLGGTAALGGGEVDPALGEDRTLEPREAGGALGPPLVADVDDGVVVRGRRRLARGVGEGRVGIGDVDPVDAGRWRRWPGSPRGGRSVCPTTLSICRRPPLARQPAFIGFCGGMYR